MKWITLAGIVLFLAQSSLTADDTVHTSALAMLNERGRLPCDVNSGLPGDRIVLILWYRGSAGTPIYSFDARGSDVDEGTHWVDRNLLQKRAFFQLSQTNSWISNSKFGAHLEIQPIKDRDQAVYRCRVDFLLSPTKNTIINFTVIIPPNKPEIYNTTEQLVGGKKGVSIIGPYNEGSKLVLVCKVTGGRPPPVVFWVVKDEVWRTDVEEEVGGTLRTTLVIPSLTRNYLHAVFQCQATNFNASAPVTSAVTIDMNFRPLNVSILRGFDPMSSSTDYELVCKTWGSRPPAVISWWKDGTEQLKHAVMTTSPDNNVTTSILKYHAYTADSGKYLSCRAENRKIPESASESTLRLNIYFQPVVTLQMGSNLNPESIKEGDDVYFECHINANPPVHKVVWYHNGAVVEHKVTQGIIIQNQTLVLQHISRNSAGLYTCRAQNNEGKGESLPVNLKVMYKPYCRRPTKTIYGTALHEPASVTCEVEASPDYVTFRWTFNNTSEHLPISASAVASQGLTSVASYAPKSHLDYGTLLCWAFNAIGEQKVPCAFAIIPAGPPDPPKNCTIANQTTDTIEVECIAGFDGGLAQVFYMEVYDSTSGALHTNLSSSEPFFLLTSLRPGIAFIMVTYAANAKGRSDSAKLETFTLKVAEKRTVYSIITPGPPALFEFTPVLGILVGLVVVILLVVIIIMIVMKFRKLQPGEGSLSSRDSLKGDMESKPLNSASLRRRPAEGSSSGEVEENDPDLIPHNNDGLMSYTQYEAIDHSGPEQSLQFDSAFQVTQGARALPLQHSSSMDDSEVTYVELSLPQEEQSTSSFPPVSSGDPCSIYASIDHTRSSSSALRNSSNNLSTASTTTNSHKNDLIGNYPPLLHRRSSSSSSFGFQNYHTSNPNLYTTIDYRRGGGTTTTTSHSIYATLPHRRDGYSSTRSISSTNTSLGGSPPAFRDIRLSLRTPLVRRPSESAV